MSRIDDLIQELCPDGVQRRPLGEFATLVRGNGMPKTDLVEEGVGAVHYGQIYTRYGVSATETFSFVSPEKAAKLAKAVPGDIIITNTSENIDDVGKALAWVGDAVIVTGGHATVIKHDQDSKFLAYWFASADFYAQKRKLATGTKVIDVSAKQLATVRIPVPPLEVQREIVRVLDQFTQLEAELEAELEARRRQYEHYRQRELTFDGSVPRAALSELARVKTGSPVSKQTIQRNPGPYPVINSGREPLGFIGEFNTERDPLGVTSRGAGVGSITWCDGPYFRGNLNYGVTIKDPSRVNVRFLYHLLQHLQPQIHALCSFQGIPALNKANLDKLIVPLPSFSSQVKIVDLLDKFDALVSDLSVGLPAELAARRKQYEYYRDKLLTFEEAVA